MPVPEERYIAKLERELGDRIEVQADHVIGKPDLALFKTRRSRVIVMLDLVCVAYSDDDYHANESQLLRELSESCGFSDDEFKSIHDWAKRQIGMIREAHRILGSISD